MNILLSNSVTSLCFLLKALVIFIASNNPLWTVVLQQGFMEILKMTNHSKQYLSLNCCRYKKSFCWPMSFPFCCKMCNCILSRTHQSFSAVQPMVGDPVSPGQQADHLLVEKLKMLYCCYMLKNWPVEKLKIW